MRHLDTGSKFLHSTLMCNSLQISICSNMSMELYSQKEVHTHIHFCSWSPANDGWQLDVCVCSKRFGITTWARSAANSSKLLTKLFLCLPPPLFFFLRGAKQLMVFLRETSKLWYSGECMQNKTRQSGRTDYIMAIRVKTAEEKAEIHVQLTSKRPQFKLSWLAEFKVTKEQNKSNIVQHT